MEARRRRAMKAAHFLRMALLIALPSALLAAPLGAQAPSPRWSTVALADLHKWVAAAPADALPAPDASALEAAERLGDRAVVDRAADGLALKLATMHLTGCCGANHAGWHIVDTDSTADLPARIAAAVSGG